MTPLYVFIVIYLPITKVHFRVYIGVHAKSMHLFHEKEKQFKSTIVYSFIALYNMTNVTVTPYISSELFITVISK